MAVHSGHFRTILLLPRAHVEVEHLTTSSVPYDHISIRVKRRSAFLLSQIYIKELLVRIYLYLSHTGYLIT